MISAKILSEQTINFDTRTEKSSQRQKTEFTHTTNPLTIIVASSKFDIEKFVEIIGLIVLLQFLLESTHCAEKNAEKTAGIFLNSSSPVDETTSSESRVGYHSGESEQTAANELFLPYPEMLSSTERSAECSIS